ncbi:MAG: hypothetical protein HYZ34_12960 [Ignavibacteriae bacterium]|nr:hypothetical protein [Ignavibacteriota bacterium]
MLKTPKVRRLSTSVLTKLHSLKQKKGMLAAIEPESGEWFLGKDVIEAFRKGREKFPHGTFYFVRIGFPSAHFLSAGLKLLFR